MSLLFVAVAVAHVMLAVFAARRGRWLLAALAVAIAVDGAVIATGSVLDEGRTLLALNTTRFAIHAVATPVLVVIAAGIAHPVGVGWATPVRAWAVTIPLIAVGVLEFLHLELVLERAAGTVRYVAADPVPPIPSILAIIVVIALGVAVARRPAGDRWMLAGSLVMFVVSGAAAAANPPWPGNIAEVILIASLVMSVRDRPTPRDQPDARHTADSVLSPPEP